VRGADRKRAAYRILDWVVGRLEAEHEQGVGAIAGHRQAGLAGVEQAAVGRVQPGLGQSAHALSAGKETVEANARRAPVGGSRLHTHPGIDDHAERALRACEHPVGARAGAGSGQPPRGPLARGRNRTDRLDQVLDVRPQGCEVAGRARGDPAAEGRVLERLREVAQGEAVLGELGLERGAGRAPLDAGRARDRVDLEHAVERAQVDRDRAVVRRADIRGDSADDGGASTERDRGDALGDAPLEHALQIALLARARDEVRGMVEASAKAADHIGVGLAEGMARARVCIVRAERPQRGGRDDARRSQLNRGRLDRLLDLPVERHPEMRRQRAGAGAHVGKRGLLILETPAPVLVSARMHPSESKSLEDH
jgi:hypothetical protein